MYVELIRYTEGADDLAGKAAAVCTRGKNPARSLEVALSSGHESVLEHVSFTFLVEGVSRTLLAQLTRHRLASFDVESQRYCDYAGAEAVLPQSITDAEMDGEYEELVQSAQDLYRRMVNAGVPREDARYVLPEGICTRLMMTMNAREVRHFCSLRSCNKAQWEIRELSDRILSECKRVAPKVFEGAGPGCVGRGCPEGRPCGSPRGADEWG